MDDIDKLLKQYSLTEVCALQWKACVEKAESDFLNISQDRIIKLKYEDFVREPVAEFAKLGEFLGKEIPTTVNKFLVSSVSSQSIGKGRSVLGDAGVSELNPLIADTLRRYGYE